MTFAWYSHLKHLNENRGGSPPCFLGHRAVRIPDPGAGQPHRPYRMNLGQLKILQEAITLAGLRCLRHLYMDQPLEA